MYGYALRLSQTVDSTIATDGVRQAHGMRQVERTQQSREQSECLVGPLAGIRVFVGPVGKTQLYNDRLYCFELCKGVTLWSRFLTNKNVIVLPVAKA
jgi:hypothetical protein